MGSKSNTLRGASASKYAFGLAEEEQVTPVRSETTSPCNVILFGETGVGKSSLINLIAGQQLAETSADVRGCTAQPRHYDITFSLASTGSQPRFGTESKPQPITVSLWDTAGLGEGTQGTVPASRSVKQLKRLLRTLAHTTEGIHLLLFCVPGTPPNRRIKHYYDLVYSSLCRKKVKIVLVVTGLENRPDEMEGWWTENEGQVRGLGMYFDQHACVTTVEATENNGVKGEEKRKLESQKRLRELLVEFTGANISPWKVNDSWNSMAVSIRRGFLRIREVVRSFPVFHDSRGISLAKSASNT